MQSFTSLLGSAGHFGLAVAVLVAAGVSLWGWGWAVARATRLAVPSWPVTLALGLAGMVLLGGGLNLAGWVRPAVLDGLALAGAGLAACSLVRDRARARTWRPTRATWLAALPLLVAGGLAIGCLLPPALFNQHDDFEKYFGHAVRMLATGTLEPNPLASLGAETLGGQAFLQTFALAHLPVAYLGAVDAVFCFLLCLCLVAFGRRPRGDGVVALAAGVGFVAINPQVVNISSVFSGAALVMAAVWVSATERNPAREGFPAVPLGLLHAALIALKTTYALFVGMHLLALVAAGGWLGRRWGKSAAVAAGVTVLALLPWLWLHAPLYGAPALPPPGLPAATEQALGLFSAAETGYGSTRLHTTLVAMLGLGAAAAVGLAVRRRRLEPSARVVALCAAGLAAGSCYFAMMLAGAPRLFGEIAAARYVVPVLVAVVPLLARLLERDDGGPERRGLPAVAGAAALLLVVGFGPSLALRARALLQARTPLVFVAQASAEAVAGFAAYNRQVLEGQVRSQLRALQDFVPAGEPLGAWVTASFHLDFTRNRILCADPAGLGMRWARTPPEVRYFLLEYRGYAVRPPGLYAEHRAAEGAADRLVIARTLAFLEGLQARAQRSRILYNDGAYVLMRLERE